MSPTRCDLTTIATIYASGIEAYHDVWSPVIVGPATNLVSRLPLEDARLVVDVGAGTGALTPALRRAAPGAAIVSVDASLAMLSRRSPTHGAVVVGASATSLPVPRGTADAVVLAYVLFHLPRPIGAIREAARVLRVSGALGTVTWGREWAPRASEVWTEVLTEHDVPPLEPGSNHEGIETTEGVHSLLRAGGLTPREVWIELVEHTFDPQEYFRLRSQFGLVAARLLEVDERRRDAVFAEAKRRLDDLDEEDYFFRAEAICGIAVRGADG